MNLNDLRDKAYKCACEHGFHDQEYSNEHWFMLTIGEVAEMVEADRKNLYPNLEAFSEMLADIPKSDELFKEAFEKYIKNTVYDEMADVVIRTLDFAGLRNIHLYSIPYTGKIGEPLPLSEYAYAVCRTLTVETDIAIKARMVIDSILIMSQQYGIDLVWFIKQKMKYNELRPYKNGKNY